MSEPQCAQLRQALGVYVLGAIDPAERAELDAHLADCPACRDELAALAGLPALLGRVSEEQLGGAAEIADGALLNRTLAQVANRRRSARRRTLLAAAAAMLSAVVLAGGGAWALRGEPSAIPSGSATSSPSATPGRTVFASDPQSDLTAAVDLTPKAWGTAVTARLSGLPKKSQCKLVAVGHGGARDVAASWTVAYADDAVFQGSTGLYPEDLARFEVTTYDGQRLLVIPVKN